MAKWGEIKCPRCEELEAQITAMEEGLTAVHMAGYMDGKKAAEAKLAKAVEDAEKYQYAFAAQSRKLQAVLHIEGVRTTLAELTGGKADV